jgi:hypothetical protein
MINAPNDAAVNAESAAKLVSELRELSEACKSRASFSSPIVENLWLQRAHAVDQAITLIERHATPQTQATHGEGEAEVEFPRFDGGKVVYDLSPAMKEGVIRDKLIAMGWKPPTPNQHTHADQCWTWGPKHYECALERIRVLEGAAPSPKAAPTLCELAKALTRLLEWPNPDGTIEEYYIPKWLAAQCREALAAAALAGVAAQGGGLSITESEKRVTNSVVDNERSTKVQGDGEARVSEDAECICKGNWRALVKKCDNRIGNTYRHKGNDYVFYGLVWSNDDFYYGMLRKYPDGHRPAHMLLSCVGSIEGHGFEALGVADQEARIGSASAETPPCQTNSGTDDAKNARPQ